MPIKSLKFVVSFSTSCPRRQGKKQLTTNLIPVVLLSSGSYTDIRPNILNHLTPSASLQLVTYNFSCSCLHDILKVRFIELFSGQRKKKTRPAQ